MRSLFCTFIVALFLTMGTASAQTEKSAATSSLDSVKVQEYLGKYDAGDIGTIVVTWEDNKLISSLEGKGSSELTLTTIPDVLTIVSFAGTATFIRNEQKKIIKVLLEVQGQVLEGVKL